MKRFLSLLTVISIFFCTMPINAQANDIAELTSTGPQENIGATVTFIDESLVNDDVANKVRGAIVSQYSHSYYIYVSRSRIASYVGPRHDDTFLCSMAPGHTKAVEEETKITGSISFTGTVDSKIKKTITAGFGLTVSGTYTKTWKTTDTFTAPNDHTYNTYSYYGAMDYDEYTTTVKRYDVYNYVDTSSGIITGTEDLYHSTININNVKSPREAEYRIGHNY